MARMKRLAILGAVLAVLCASCSGGRGNAAGPGSSAVDQHVSTPPPGAFVFAVKGDWGGGTRDQQEVTKEMCAIRKKIPFRYVVTTGDNFYNPDGTATQSNYYRPERCLNDYPGNTWRAVWGNHDLGGSSTGSVLGAPHHYTWTAGATQFFMLDANSPGDPVQRAWLQTTLASSRARVKIVVFHQPAITSGLHGDNESAKRSWVPLFEQYHVTLVLTGHNHDYEHLKVRGIHYVVTGGGGESRYPCLRTEPGAIRCVSAFHFLLVTVTRSAVAVEAILPSGVVLDRFAIEN
jgi:hypothetical protein